MAELGPAERSESSLALPHHVPAATVGPGSEFDGLVVLRGPGRIDGRVRGQVVADDLVWIGEQAEVEADVEAEEVVVAGRLEGRVRARRRIELLDTARVVGTLEAPKIAMEEGSLLQGRCQTAPG